jgi:hypothetical protein
VTRVLQGRGRRLFMKRETIGDAYCPIMRRLIILRTRAGSSLRIHEFLPNADDRDVHDHPWWFLTFVVTGYYDDMKQCVDCEGLGQEEHSSHTLDGGVVDFALTCETCDGTGVVLNERMDRGKLRYRPASHAHRTRVGPRGCTTLVVTGPVTRSWGFWLGHTWSPWRKYVALHGKSMRCDDD